jgi:hypothetical protein
LLRGYALEFAILADGVATVGLGMQIGGLLSGTPNQNFAQLACRIHTFHVQGLSLNCTGGIHSLATMQFNALCGILKLERASLHIQTVQSAWPTRLEHRILHEFTEPTTTGPKSIKRGRG